MNATLQNASIPQTWVRQIDHIGSPTNMDTRAGEGCAIGSVRLPMERSPSWSLKSCAWSVVANIAMLRNTAKRALGSSRDISLPGCGSQ
jgi:hypothetical protein